MRSLVILDILILCSCVFRGCGRRRELRSLLSFQGKEPEEKRLVLICFVLFCLSSHSLLQPLGFSFDFSYLHLISQEGGGMKTRVVD